MIDVVFKSDSKKPQLKVSEIPIGQPFKANWYTVDGPKQLFVNVRICDGTFEGKRVTVCFNNWVSAKPFATSNPLNNIDNKFYFNVELVDIEVKEL